jgi:small subunit ribosomal protein S3
VIGRGGENIKTMTDVIKNKYNIDNPNIEVKQVEFPDLDANVVSQKIVDFLERGYYFKKIVHRFLDQVMIAGARGVELRINGKIPSDRAKIWIFKKGYIRHCGEVVKNDVDVGYAEAQLKTGVVGVRVRIMPPDVKFPDEILLGNNIDSIVLTEKTAVVEETK